MAKKEIEVWEGKLDNISDWSENDGLPGLDDKPIDHILESFKGKVIRLTIEVIE